ncbi:MAG: shikimate kinase [Moraxellaceae bacterium]|nr:shikimate kinase [Moraxellaceae bacterium]
MIHLIGPGGAGKSTLGATLARRLALTYVDLDSRFLAEHGVIGEYIGQHGYRSYAASNVALYLRIIRGVSSPVVMVMSSGFMTYEPDIHPLYPRLHDDILRDTRTIVVLPSLSLEECVRETLRRQRERAFAGAPAREETKIRQRFPVYAAMSLRKVETMRGVDALCEELVPWLMQPATGLKYNVACGDSEPEL